MATPMSRRRISPSSLIPDSIQAMACNHRSLIRRPASLLVRIILPLCGRQWKVDRGIPPCKREFKLWLPPSLASARTDGAQFVVTKGHQ